MPNNYWEKRMEQLHDAQMNQADMFNNELARSYMQAMRDMQNDVNSWYARFARNNQISLAEAKKMLNEKQLAELKWNVKQYVKYAERNAMTGQYIKQLENASIRVHINRLQALQIQLTHHLESLYHNQNIQMQSFIKNLYASSEYKTAYELQCRRGFEPFEKLQNDLLTTIANKPWAVDGQNFSQRIWRDKNKLINVLQQDMTQSLIRGENPNKLVSKIADRMGVANRAAKRLVLTESAFFATSAEGEAFNKLGVEKYEIIATLDLRTSEICQHLDGKVFNMKDFQPGVTAPPFHAHCRSATAPHFDDDFSQGETRIARDSNGRNINVPADMTYDKWYDKYVKEQKPSRQTSKGLGVAPFTSVLPKNRHEYLDVAKQAAQYYKTEGLDNVAFVIESQESSTGFCALHDNPNYLDYYKLSLKKGDQRSSEYLMKTAYHDAYHLAGNKRKTDFFDKTISVNNVDWLSVEETFAETSAHYLMQVQGYKKLSPSYAEKLVYMLPRLKRLDEFKDASILADFGKIAADNRAAGQASVWKSLIQRTSTQNINAVNYAKQYLPYIKQHQEELIDLLLKNMVEYKNFKASMLNDLTVAIDMIEKGSYPKTGNVNLIFDNALINAMNAIGVI